MIKYCDDEKYYRWKQMINNSLRFHNDFDDDYDSIHDNSLNFSFVDEKLNKLKKKKNLYIDPFSHLICKYFQNDFEFLLESKVLTSKDIYSFINNINYFFHEDKIKNSISGFTQYSRIIDLVHSKTQNKTHPFRYCYTEIIKQCNQFKMKVKKCIEMKERNELFCILRNIKDLKFIKDVLKHHILKKKGERMPHLKRDILLLVISKLFNENSYFVKREIEKKNMKYYNRNKEDYRFFYFYLKKDGDGTTRKGFINREKDEDKRIVLTRAVMIIIMSFLRKNVMFLNSIALVNERFYLLAIESWENIYVTPKNIFKLPVFLIANLKRITFSDANFYDNFSGEETFYRHDIMFLLSNLKKIEFIQFSSECGRSIEFFFTCLKHPLNNCKILRIDLKSWPNSYTDSVKNGFFSNFVKVYTKFLPNLRNIIFASDWVNKIDFTMSHFKLRKEKFLHFLNDVNQNSSSISRLEFNNVTQKTMTFIKGKLVNFRSEMYKKDNGLYQIVTNEYNLVFNRVYIVEKNETNNLCLNCGKSVDDLLSEGKKLKTCSVCKNAFYCSRKCQIRHWKIHKKKCFLNERRKNVGESRNLKEFMGFGEKEKSKKDEFLGDVDMSFENILQGLNEKERIFSKK